MNPRLRCTLTVTALFAATISTAALAAKPEGKGKKPAPAAPAKAKPEVGEGPKQQLAPYINHIDQLLALDRPSGPKLGPLINKAPGHLATMKANFASRQAKAQGAEAARFAAAIATCDAITAALDERQRTYGQISANSAVKGSGDLGRRRKDNFSEGTVGGDLTRTVDVIEQARRERAHNKEMNQRAARTDNALSQGSINRWNQRSIELRQQITALYAKIG